LLSVLSWIFMEVPALEGRMAGCRGAVAIGPTAAPWSGYPAGC
jgi:hypothetical protein